MSQEPGTVLLRDRPRPGPSRAADTSSPGVPTLGGFGAAIAQRRPLAGLQPTGDVASEEFSDRIEDELDPENSDGAAGRVVALARELAAPDQGRRYSSSAQRNPTSPGRSVPGPANATRGPANRRAPTSPSAEHPGGWAGGR
ncbi:hypothetical protein ACWC9T_40945 [Kitasatospora sp. NPDC001159]